MSPICRTCLKEIATTDFVNLNDASLSISKIRSKLTLCMPEMDLDIVENAVICTQCISDLHTAYSFKNRCLEIEEKIQHYIKNSTSDTAKVELNHLLSSTDTVELVPVTDPLLIENVKQEPLYNANYEESYFDLRFEENFVKTESLSDVDMPNEMPLKSENHQQLVDNDTSEKTKTLSPKSSTKRYKCNKCSEQFGTYKLLNTHKKSHIRKVPYKCTQCDFSSRQSKELIRHVQTHTQYPVMVNVTTMKRKAFTVEDKVDLIRKLESGKKISEVCRETGMATSTVCCIWKNKEIILGAFENNGPHLKRLRKPVHADVDEALFIWYKEQNLDVPITGPLLRAKALELARAMGNYDFVSSGSWLDRFKARHSICLGKKRCT